MPLAIRWPGRIKPATQSDAFISHLDFAPTFLSAAGLGKRPQMSGTSILDLIANPTARQEIFTERERHAFVRPNGLGYPCRAVRTRRHLYIRNFTPDRWPAGNPDMEHASQGRYGDIDAGPSKKYLIDHKDDPKLTPLFTAAAAKRPPEELYDVITDPTQLKNLAEDPAQFQAKRDLKEKLDTWMAATADPRSTDPATDYFDKVPYLGNEVRRNRQNQPARPGV
jgi:arylsulfatase A-like enzyme